jgi:hypothetical protein
VPRKSAPGEHHKVVGVISKQVDRYRCIVPASSGSPRRPFLLPQPVQ